ncbi:MAG: SDR family oxidoreductase [Rhodospirillales bacterium]|nr:SDR family oxidoreductase [Rhodospirillales bacterium]
MNRNLFGTFLFCRLAIPQIIKSGGGSVINTSSILAMQGAPGTDCYSASKGAVTALTASLAARFGKEGIRVNAIAPGMTRTARIEKLIANHEKVRKNMARYLLGTVLPEEVAYLAVFLASDESKHLSGAVIPIDCAGRHAPAAWM